MFTLGLAAFLLAIVSLGADLNAKAIKRGPKSAWAQVRLGRVRFVSTGGDDANDCSSPATACRTVQRAVDLAGAGDVIKVATGVYTDDDVANVGCLVALTKTVVLRGGYDTAFSVDPPDPSTHPTTLHARGLGRAIRITGDISPTIEGFIVTGGNASGLGGALIDGVPGDVGGGIYGGGASPIIVDNVITGNVASTLTSSLGLGGGIGLVRAPTLALALIQGNWVISNVASTGYEGNGGGLYLGESAATVVSNTVDSNIGSTAYRGGGGGVYVAESEGITISDNLVRHNIGSTAMDGVAGGVAVFGSNGVLVSGNTVLSNTSSSGGYGKGGGLGLKYASNLLISDNQVRGNIASTAQYGYGGGVFVKYSDRITITANALLYNVGSTVGEGRGGGIHVMADSHITLSGNRVQGNIAGNAYEGYGGGLCIWLTDDFTLMNNLVVGNSASLEGGGLSIKGIPQDPAVGQVVHTTIADNAADSEGHGQGLFVGDYAALTLAHNIVAGHSEAGITATVGSSLTVRYNLFWGNGSDPITGTQALVGDPLFMASGEWDYHLRPGSAAIDSGDPAALVDPQAQDLDGNPRRVDGDRDGKAVVDIGAYEFQPGTRVWLPVVAGRPTRPRVRTRPRVGES